MDYYELNKILSDLSLVGKMAPLHCECVWRCECTRKAQACSETWNPSPAGIESQWIHEHHIALDWSSRHDMEAIQGLKRKRCSSLEPSPTYDEAEHQELLYSVKQYRCSSAPSSIDCGTSIFSSLASSSIAPTEEPKIYNRIQVIVPEEPMKGTKHTLCTEPAKSPIKNAQTVQATKVTKIELRKGKNSPRNQLSFDHIEPTTPIPYSIPTSPTSDTTSEFDISAAISASEIDRKRFIDRLMMPPPSVKQAASKLKASAERAAKLAEISPREKRNKTLRRRKSSSRTPEWRAEMYARGLRDYYGWIEPLDKTADPERYVKWLEKTERQGRKLKWLTSGIPENWGIKPGRLRRVVKKSKPRDCRW